MCAGDTLDQRPDDGPKDVTVMRRLHLDMEGLSLSGRCTEMGSSQGYHRVRSRWLRRGHNISGW
jgi:hypothetical protein